MHPVGFIGTGFHAQTNLLPAAAIGGVDIVALASRDAGRSATALARAGFGRSRAFGSVDELLAATSRPDRVIVCAQPADQPAIVRELVGAGVHVLAEKPLGRDEAEARALAALAESRGVVLRAAFMKRFAPAVLRLRADLESGVVGDVLSFDVRFGADAAAFAPTPADFVRLAAIHHVDLVRFLLGDVAHVDVALSGNADAYTVIVTARLRSGAIGVLHLTNSPGHTSEVDIVTVIGTEGTATLSDTRELVVHRRSPDGADWGRSAEQRSVFTPSISTMSGAAQDLVLRGFVDEIRSFATEELDDGDGRTVPDRSADENRRTMAMVDAIVGGLPTTGKASRPLVFGAPGEVRDALNEAVVSGRKTSSTTLLVAYGALGDTVPRPGETRVLLDSDDEPLATILFERVAQRRLGDVDGEVTALEHLEPERWNAVHREYWASITPQIRVHLSDDGWDLSDDEVIVTTEFRVIRPE
ncbi:Gfo/Idh/MocA family oxidoreductase [Microbacterium sp. 179-I 3D3 NHS]|uniref:Gfo/Idh/MocA family oxidoreductase n=1 Tax=Microbacterium sp. 179-I 3D3 NHS TaxID=3142382 RepID=UPI0039A0BAA3